MMKAGKKGGKGGKGCSADMISPRKAMAMGMKPAVVKKGKK